MQQLQRALAQARNGELRLFEYEFEYTSALEELWSPPPPPKATASESASHEDLEALDGVSFSLSLSIREPNTWSIAFTPTFQKSVATVDKKLQGRVLAALADLSEAPTTPHGDTVKPLAGEFKGLWRYRVGDYRLVYEPQEPVHMVVLLEFAARGGVYE